jgi:catechol 2,3-dioxygenase-like lactoylglutathione lyase family enzyme
VTAKLEVQGIKATIRQDKPEVYFNDPDGIRFQLENKNYRG